MGKFVPLEKILKQMMLKGKIFGIGVVLLAAMLTVSCQHAEPTEEALLENQAKDFGEAWYNWRYVDVAAMVTPESAKWVQLMATNVTEADVEAVNDAGSADVSVDGVQLESDTLAVVRFEVDDYMRPQQLGEIPVLSDDVQQEFRFVKRQGKWLVSLSGI